MQDENQLFHVEDTSVVLTLTHEKFEIILVNVFTTIQFSSIFLFIQLKAFISSLHERTHHLQKIFCRSIHFYAHVFSMLLRESLLKSSLDGLNLLKQIEFIPIKWSKDVYNLSSDFRSMELLSENNLWWQQGCFQFISWSCHERGKFIYTWPTSN